MSTIDKQRIAAVRKLGQLGHMFAAGDWMRPTNDTVPAPAITDALYALLVMRADNVEGCPDASDEERELEAITMRLRPMRLFVGRWDEREAERVSNVAE